MAQKKILQKVKSASGYDILNPMTPWQVQNCLFDPTSTSSLFKLETVMPAENLDDKCLAIFTPTITSKADVQIQINGVDFGNIKWNGKNLSAGALPANQIATLLIDFTNLVASVQIPTGSMVSVAEFSTALTDVWVGDGPWTQQLSVPGILASDNPIVDVVLSGDTDIAKAQLEAWGFVSQILTEGDLVVATCFDEEPTVEIPIHLRVVR